ncbi:MAG: AIR synthase-related protein [Marinilabiliales bacterium]|nr:AIR synthase-related protein [Marinilabiliales bacterium]
MKRYIPEKGDLIVLLGGDNYRIGMGGGAVSSVDTGKFDSSIELNAVQRANPEMQKRVYNAIRALVNRITILLFPSTTMEQADT